MATNPMQKRARNAFLLGFFIMLIIAAIAGAAVYFLVLRNNVVTSEGEVKAYVYALKQDVESGQEINENMVKEVVVSSDAAPKNALAARVQDTNGKTKKQSFIVALENATGYTSCNSKIDLKAGTIIGAAMVNKGEELSNDTRLVEYNMITLPTTLAKGDFIDIRFTMPSGQDYIVVSKKEIVDLKGNTISLYLNEGEILTLGCAIVESYIMSASNIYAIQYIEPGMQEKAIPTYPVNAEVFSLITSNSNIENLNNVLANYQVDLRNNNVNANISEYSDERLENIQEGIEEQKINAQKARSEYLSSLAGY